MIQALLICLAMNVGYAGFAEPPPPAQPGQPGAQTGHPIQPQPEMEKLNAGSASGDPNEMKMSGVVRMIRENPVPQVFFVDNPGTFVVPEGDDFAKFFNVFAASQRTKKPVNFTFNKKTKNIVAVEGSYQKDTRVYEDMPIDLPPEENAAAAATAKANVNPAEAQKKSVDDFLKSLDAPKK